MRRPARAVAAWGLLALGFVVSVFGPAVPGIREDFGLGLAEVGLLAVVNSLGYVGGVLTGGLVADRHGRRRVVLAGAGALVVSVLAFMLAPTWPLALLASALVGVAIGLVDGPANALVNEHSGQARGGDLNLVHGFFGVGSVIGPLLAGGLLAFGVGWRWVYLPAMLVAVALGWRAWRLPLGAEPALPGGLTELRLLTREPIIWLLALILCLYVGVEMMVGAWAFSHLRTAFAAGNAAAGLASALFWGGLTLGRLLMGALGDRLHPHHLIIGNVVGAAVTLGLLVVAPTLWLAVIVLGLIGLTLANIFPAVIAVAGEAYPRAVGATSGLLIAAGGVGGAIFPWLTGVVGEMAGLGVALAGGLGLLALLFAAELAVLLLQRRRAQSMMALERAARA